MSFPVFSCCPSYRCRPVCCPSFSSLATFPQFRGITTITTEKTDDPRLPGFSTHLLTRHRPINFPFLTLGLSQPLVPLRAHPSSRPDLPSWMYSVLVTSLSRATVLDQLSARRSVPWRPLEPFRYIFFLENPCRAAKKTIVKDPNAFYPLPELQQ